VITEHYIFIVRLCVCHFHILKATWLDLSNVYNVVAVPKVPWTTSAFDPVFPLEYGVSSTSSSNQSRSSTAAPGSKSTAGEVQTAAQSTSLPPRPAVTEGAFCEARFVRKVEWPATAAGKTAVVECPNNRNSQCFSPNIFVYCLIVLDQELIPCRYLSSCCWSSCCRWNDGTLGFFISPTRRSRRRRRSNNNNKMSSDVSSVSDLKISYKSCGFKQQSSK